MNAQEQRLEAVVSELRQQLEAAKRWAADAWAQVEAIAVNGLGLPEVDESEDIPSRWNRSETLSELVRNWKDRAEAAERKLANLIAALQPFATAFKEAEDEANRISSLGGYIPLDNEELHIVIDAFPCRITVGDIKSASQALAQSEHPQNDVAMEQRCLDFVKGAKWWEWTKNNATMWQADQHAAYEAAKLLFSGSSEPWPPEHRPQQEEVKEALQRISEWANEAYPVEAFPEQELKRANEVLAIAGISMSAMHGQWARHLTAGIGEIAKQALEPVGQPPTGIEHPQRSPIPPVHPMAGIAAIDRKAQAKLPGEDSDGEPCQCSACVALRARAQAERTP